MATRRPLREPASVSDDRRTTVRGKLTHHVGGDASYTVRQNRTVDIGRDDDLKVGGSARDAVGGDRTAEIGGSEALSIGRDRAAAIGKDDRLNVARKLLIDAGDEVTIKCGAASITLKKDGTITIKGKDIVIDASGDGTFKAAKNIVLKGQKILDN